jgi:hypothetical protein
VLSCPVLHADETPVAMLDPGAGKTKRAYIWAYARGEFDIQQGVIYEFCLGRGSQYPVAFLGAAQGPPGSAMQEQPAWQGTLVCDQYGGYDAVLDKRVYPRRIAAHCAAHARRKFDELLGTSEVAKEAIKRIGWIYHVEGQLEGMDAQQRQAAREQLTRPLWKELHVWLKLERGRVPDGGSIAAAIDYSLNAWDALTRHLQDGAVPIDNNFIERQIKPWAMGRKAWLFCGSELAGQRAAIVMSLVQSAKLNGHDPWAYLRDVLERLPPASEQPHRRVAAAPVEGRSQGGQPQSGHRPFGSADPVVRLAPTAAGARQPDVQRTQVHLDPFGGGAGPRLRGTVGVVDATACRGAGHRQGDCGRGPQPTLRRIFAGEPHHPLDVCRCRAGSGDLQMHHRGDEGRHRRAQRTGTRQQLLVRDSGRDRHVCRAVVHRHSVARPIGPGWVDSANPGPVL